MIYQDRHETKSLQLVAYSKNSEWFSTIFVFIFEFKIAAEQKQAELKANLWSYKLQLPSTLLLLPCPTTDPVSCIGYTHNLTLTIDFSDL